MGFPRDLDRVAAVAGFQLLGVEDEGRVTGFERVFSM